MTFLAEIQAERRRGGLLFAMLMRTYLWRGQACAAALAMSATLVIPTLSQTQSPNAPSPATGQQTAKAAPAPAAETPSVKPDAKKAREADKEGLRAEGAKDWPAAYDAFSHAVNWAPSNREYLMHRELSRSRLVQSKMDLAERAALVGKLPEARKQLLEARYLDPTNTVVRERLEELSALEPDQVKQLPDEFDLAGGVQMEHATGKRSINYRGTTQGAYQEVAKQFGVNVAFDVDLPSRPIHFQTDNEDFVTTLQVLGTMTKTFWRPLEKHLFFVAADTAQKRKEYATALVRTVLLPASVTPTQMTEIFRLVREIAGITRAELDTRSRTITMRASPQAIKVATGVIEDLEQPVPELVLEIEVLNVNRTYAQQLGITPPQTSRVFTLNRQQVQEALASEQGLIQVIEQVFGTPAAFSGLTNSQLAGLLSSGQVGVGSLLPPLVVFGGGDLRFLATMPGASANLSEMLSLVKTGRRILLRAEDGAPATFFVGDRIPVTLAQFSPSLGGGLSNIAGVSSANFPMTDLTTGNTPVFVASADLESSGDADLIVANKNDDTLSIFLGDGQGNFSTPAAPDTATVPTGKAPVWVAVGSFNSDTTKPTGDTIPDLAVANNADNTVSILLGDGKGGFTAAPTINTGAGTSPVAIAVADFNGDGFQDLAVVDQGTNQVQIFLGNGDGTFSVPTAPKPAALTTGLAPSSIVAADFNSDGKIDLAVTNANSDAVSVFLGNGDGTFGARTDYSVGAAPVYVVSADFNGDGIPDLAVADSGAPATASNGDLIPGNSVSILLGNPSAANSAVGDGTFQAANSFAAGTTPTSIAVADVNIDGRPDLVVASSGDNAVSLLLGVGDGTFGPNLEVPVGTDPVSVVSADFNNDGKPDAALANAGSNTVTVILNESSFEGTTPNGLAGTPFPGVQYIDVGVKVKATPRVHGDDEVSVQLRFEISSLAGESFNSVPVISNETVEQTVRVKQDETAVVAGFREEDYNRALNGTPGLADLPAVGVLGSDTNLQKQDTELIFMITPRRISMPPSRKEHLIYAGRGAVEGPGSGPIGPAQREVPPAFQQPQQPTETPGQPPQVQPLQRGLAPGQFPGQPPTGQQQQGQPPPDQRQQQQQQQQTPP
jgi:Bacterial type II and III secretion system protein/FG-GAP-like repeat